MKKNSRKYNDKSQQEINEVLKKEGRLKELESKAQHKGLNRTISKRSSKRPFHGMTLGWLNTAPLVLDLDKRDFSHEVEEELLDAMNYLILRLSD